MVVVLQPAPLQVVPTFLLATHLGRLGVAFDDRKMPEDPVAHYLDGFESRHRYLVFKNTIQHGELMQVDAPQLGKICNFILLLNLRGQREYLPEVTKVHISMVCSPHNMSLPNMDKGSTCTNIGQWSRCRKQKFSTRVSRCSMQIGYGTPRMSLGNTRCSRHGSGEDCGLYVTWGTSPPGTKIDYPILITKHLPSPTFIIDFQQGESLILILTEETYEFLIYLALTFAYPLCTFKRYSCIYTF